LKPVLKPGGDYLKGIVSEKRKDAQMKTQFALFTHYTQKINRHHIQLAVTIVSLALLVLGIGAPIDGSGPGPR